MVDVDTGEYVEVAGPAGTDLTGWKLEFYNGNNDSLYDQITRNLIIKGVIITIIEFQFPAS